MTSIDLDVDRCYGVGPLTDVYDHGPVTAFVDDPEDGHVLIACLDCGYVAADIRRFAHEECDRSTNRINTTWRELVERDGFPGT